ncbi:Htur_1727 family rSAM-partnered candidate RiPP [Halobacteria archaeon AArc-m2/3/4]|uniref:Htur_1727 family rSAM-partnered candidate RiPP n=1 Tax=Natronoglomus mannanivorans TaxID=2979990 RepID=A0AAP2YXG6_9EURY|nr:Htur_1727 family rSAM-partnered candidate RiPP [Halobacteria archaeon AArc-xg1-1]MCU4975664.1 Htur_1727 family rSAM-partnered candidate RiPP [Halobacteria archaeon AArc-m2/3/4]
MVEKARRSRVDDDGERRGTPIPQWEVFVREDETDPLRHVGSVAATDAAEAADHASRLFGWYAADLWVCPADAVERYSTRPLSESESGAGSEQEAGEAPHETGSDAETGSGSKSEPRVYEETEGTPRVNDP